MIGRIFNQILGAIIGFVPFLLVGLVIGYFGNFESRDSSAIVNAVGIGIVCLAINSKMFRPRCTVAAQHRRTGAHQTDHATR